ncbi:MAG: hypothetical protein ABIE74_00910 [Pseudomonadota bacterium]
MNILKSSKMSLITLILTLILILPIKAMAFDWGDLWPFAEESGSGEVIDAREQLIEAGIIQDEEGGEILDLMGEDGLRLFGNYQEMDFGEPEEPKSYDQQIEDLKADFQFQFLDTLYIELSQDNPRVELDAGEEFRITAEVENIDLVGAFEPISIAISEYHSNVEGMEVVGGGFRFEIFADEESPSIKITVSSPEIMEYIMGSDVLEGYGYFYYAPSKAFTGIFDKLGLIQIAHAQETMEGEFGEPSGGIPGEMPSETGPIGGGVVEQPTVEGEIGQDNGLQIWGDEPGETPQEWEPPINNGGIQIVDEAFGIGMGKNTRSKAKRYFINVPSTLSPEGIVWKVDPKDLMGGFEGGKVPQGKPVASVNMRVVKDKPTATPPKKVPTEGEVFDFNCEYIFSDGFRSNSSKRPPEPWVQNMPVLHSFDKHPLYRVCGVQFVASEISKQIGGSGVMSLQKSFMETFASIISEDFLYMFGDADSLPGAIKQSDTFNFQIYPVGEWNKSISVGFRTSGTTSSYSSQITTSGVRKVKIEYNVSDLVEYFRNLKTKQNGVTGKDMMMAVIAPEVLRSFTEKYIFDNAKAEKVKEWVTKNQQSNQMLSDFAREQAADNSSLELSPPAPYFEGVSSALSGIQLFTTSKAVKAIKRGSQISLKNADIPIGGDSFSDFFPGVSDYYSFIRNSLKSGNLDFYDAIVTDQLGYTKNTPDELGKYKLAKARDFMRYINNRLLCRTYTSNAVNFMGSQTANSSLDVILMDPLWSGPFDGVDKTKDVEGLIVQEYGVADSANLFYGGWMTCAPMGPGQQVQGTSGSLYMLDSFKDQFSDFANQKSFSFKSSMRFEFPGSYDANGKLLIKDDDSPVNIFLELPATVQYNIFQVKKEQVEYFNPIANVMMLPYSAFLREVEFKYAVSEEGRKANDRVISFYFYAPDQKYVDQYFPYIFVSVYVKYLDGKFMLRQYALDHLPTVETPVDIVLANSKGEINMSSKQTLIAKELKIGVGDISTGQTGDFGIPQNEMLIKTASAGIPMSIKVAVVNANETGTFPNYLPNIPISCDRFNDKCDEWGLKCNYMTNRCEGNEKINLPVYVSAKIRKVDKCPTGKKMTRSGECGCDKGDAIWGSECPDGYITEVVDGKCKCVTKCGATEKWDPEAKSCKSCGNNSYNRHYDSKNPASIITECQKCPNNTEPVWELGAGGRSCAPTVEYALGCSAVCGCNNKAFKMVGFDESSFCRADCDPGSIFDSTKSSPAKQCKECDFFQKSNKERTKCEACNPGVTEAQIASNYSKYKFFFIESDPEKSECFYPKDKCDSSNQYYDVNLKKCMACPQNSSSDFSKDPTICECLKKYAVTPIENVAHDEICSYNCSYAQRVSTDKKRCEDCPEGEMRNPLDQNKCRTCPIGALDDKTHGCQCPAGSKVVDMNKWMCECPLGSTYSENGCMCLNGKRWIYEKNTWGMVCRCADDERIVNGVCNCPSSVATVNSTVAKKFACKQDGTICDLFSKSSCTCNPGYTFTADKAACVKSSCQKGQIMLNGKCYWDSAYQGCKKITSTQDYKTSSVLSQSANCSQSKAWNGACMGGSSGPAGPHTLWYCPGEYPYGGNYCGGSSYCCFRHSDNNLTTNVTGVTYSPVSGSNYCCPAGMKDTIVGTFVVCQ